VLTGFKWIAELIRTKAWKETYIIGGEESFGLMVGNKVRDKDAVSAVAIICEMAAYEKNKGKTLYDKLIDLYVKYGLYKESLVSITKKGMNGVAQIADMMREYRDNPPLRIGGITVTELLDYQLQKATNLKTKEIKKIELPKSNVLQFILEDGSKISARPSGTEPKIKFYFSVNTKLEKVSEFVIAEKKLDDKIAGIVENLKLK